MQTENLKTFTSDCSIKINNREFIVAEIVVPTTCNNKNSRYDICQIYELVDATEDDGYIFTKYIPIDYFYGASNQPEEIIKDAKTYSDTYCKKDLYGNDRVIVTTVK